MNDGYYISKKQTNIANRISIISSFLGIIGIFLTCFSTNNKLGIQLVLNDPGKVFFHIFILPVAIRSFFKNFPYLKIKKISPKWKIALISQVIACFVFGSILTGYEHINRNCSRLPSPEILPLENRESIPIYSEWQEKRKTIIKENSAGLLTKNPGTDNHLNPYVDSIESERKNLCSVNYWTFYFKDRYWKILRISEAWSLLLSLLAIFFYHIVFCSLLAIYPIKKWNRKFPFAKIIPIYNFILFSILLWVPLRAYSEFYLGNPLTKENFPSFTPLCVSLIISSIGLYILNFLYDRKSIIKSTIPLLITISLIFFISNESLLSKVILWWYTIDSLSKLIIYLCLGTSICLLHFLVDVDMKK